jgi:hypothetical protein
MASNITASDLIITITEQITLNGQPINSENTLTIEDVDQFDKRIMNIPTSEVTVVSFGSIVAAGTFVKGVMKYFRVTNKDTVNYARIRVKQTNSYCFDVKLDAGKSFMMGNVKENTSQTAVTFAQFADADSISCQADSSPIDIEYVVASI